MEEIRKRPPDSIPLDFYEVEEWDGP